MKVINLKFSFRRYGCPKNGHILFYREWSLYQAWKRNTLVVRRPKRIKDGHLPVRHEYGCC